MAIILGRKGGGGGGGGAPSGPAGGVLSGTYPNPGYATTPYQPGGTDVALADGGTGASLVDPNADRVLFWDDSLGAITWLELGTGLSISGTVITAKRTVELLVTDPNGDAITTGDGKTFFCVPLDMNGQDLVAVAAAVTTVSSSGTPTIQIRNVTQAADMLTTRITIDANENTSYTAATPPVIDTSNDDVATGDLIAVDLDVAGTGAKGLIVLMTFQAP